MPWNPAPEVAVARDAAKRIGTLAKSRVRQIVLLYVTDDDKIGYASYGKDAAQCSGARVLADRMYAVAQEHFMGEV